MKRMIFDTARAFAFLLLITFPIHAEEEGDDRIIAVEDIRSDFKALYASLKSAHADLYAHRDKEAYDALYTETLASFNTPLSLFDVKVAFQKFVAYGNVAHARIDFSRAVYARFREQGGVNFPIYPRIVDGRAFVGENYSGLAEIGAGDEMLSLNGKPMKYWLDCVASNISADTDYIAHSLLEFSFPQYLWLEIGEVPDFELTLRTPAGMTRTVTVPATTREAQAQEAEKQPEQFALSSVERVQKMLDGGIAYLRPGPFYNAENPEEVWDNSAFVAFIDSAFEGFIQAGARKLIIDLRDNPGGDNSFSDPMLAWFADKPFRFNSAFLIRSSDEAAASNQARLDASADAASGVSGVFAQKYAETPRGEMFEFDLPFAAPRDGAQFEGPVYVLINRHSYSNAVTVAAMVQDYGFGVIAGEKTSDMATTYGAMETFTLPATGISVGFPKAYIIRPSGERKSDGVTPDLPITSPIVPTKDDVVLNTLVAKLRASK